MKILVVHRQEVVADQIRSILRDNNPVVIHCDSGFDGLLTSRIENFDLIICGIDLPVVTGFEMVRAIRNNSINRKVAVIMMAEELNYKTDHLGTALGVAGMLVQNDMDEKLGRIVKDAFFTKATRRGGAVNASLTST